MNSETKLHYLIDFLSDNSFEVRDEILKQLNNYGTSLEHDLQNYMHEIDIEKQTMITPILESNRRIWLEENWNCWLLKETENDQIETALNLISRFQYGLSTTLELSEILDKIADEFYNKIPYGDELDLANFLFQENGIKGAKENYYNPFNSNPIFAIKEKKGLPITLALIYILVGNRLGFEILGCNYPGHFLAKIVLEEETIFIDCFNGGKIIYESELTELAVDSVDALVDIMRTDVSVKNIILRVLNNLISAYTFLNDTADTQLFTRLHQQTLSLR